MHFIDNFLLGNIPLSFIEYYKNSILRAFFHTSNSNFNQSHCQIEPMLAKEKRQKIDPIHLCFGDSGRLFRSTENRPD